jgi:hypothetical protein
MDLTAFETWLGEIAALTEPQRRRAWQALALSETAYGGEIETPQLVDRGLGNAGDEPPATSAPPPLAQPSSPIDVVSVADLGTAVWSALAVPIATTTTWSGGVRPAIYHATAAKPVGARSTR